MSTPGSDRKPDEQLSAQDKEELLSRRIEESVVKRLNRNFSIFGVLLTVLGVFGFFGLTKYLEFKLSDSISRSVNKSITDKVEESLHKADQRLKAMEGDVEAARKRVDNTSIETEYRLKSTVDQVSTIGHILVDDVERRRKELASKMAEESQKFEDARKEAERQSNKLLAGISEQLQILKG